MKKMHISMETIKQLTVPDMRHIHGGLINQTQDQTLCQTAGTWCAGACTGDTCNSEPTTCTSNVGCTVD